MVDEKPCPLCKNKCTIRSSIDTVNNTPKQPIHDTECPICGNYFITSRAQYFLQNHMESLHIISGITRNYYEYNDTSLTITEQMVGNDSVFESKVLNAEPKSVPDKTALLLKYIAHKSEHPGSYIDIKYSRDYPICFSKGPSELKFYTEHLIDIGDIIVEAIDAEHYNVRLTADGWQNVQNLTKPNTDSKQAFVAMWFDKRMDEVFEYGIKPLEKDTGFNMFRVDKTQFIDEKICDKIIIEIKKSRFLIVDVTGQRQAVYFEAGYAMGMGLQVIWTCKESDVEECCFDTRQYNHIIWKDAEDLQYQLNERILATIGKA